MGGADALAVGDRAIDHQALETGILAGKEGEWLRGSDRSAPGLGCIRLGHVAIALSTSEASEGLSRCQGQLVD